MKGRMIPEMGETLADLLEGLGDVPPGRIPLRPPPGTAGEQDVIAGRRKPEKWLFELADRALVLKPPGFAQSVLAGALCHIVLNYLDEHELGVGFGPSAMYRLKDGLVRIPDFTFVSWGRLPGGEVPDVEIADIVPDLVVEFPRQGHTKREMDRKVREYFEAGVRLVWLIHYPQRTAEVYTSAKQQRQLTENSTLDGLDVLPGLMVPLHHLFARLDRQG